MPSGPPASPPAPGSYPRPLTDRERQVLALLADGLPEGHPARAEVSSAEAVRRCGCGTCPSIELSPAENVEDGTSRLVVSADHRDALLLLFVDGGHLSYLEAAPWTEDGAVLEFPPPEEISGLALD